MRISNYGFVLGLWTVVLLAAASMACMKVPEGTHILVTDTPETVCNQHANCYYAPTRTIVLAPGQSLRTLAHEGCHAHQHWVILEETGAEPHDLTLDEWLDTSEGRAYAAVVEAAGPNPWDAHYAPLIEDFAEACGRYMARWELDPVRAEFFAGRDFQ